MSSLVTVGLLQLALEQTGTAKVAPLAFELLAKRNLQKKSVILGGTFQGLNNGFGTPSGKRQHWKRKRSLSRH